MTGELHSGLEIRCPRCRQWHVTFQPATSATTAERDYLYVRCGPDLLYAGTHGTPSRHEIREKANANGVRPSLGANE